MTIEQQFFNEYRLLYRPFINRFNLQLEEHGLFSSQWALIRLLTDKGSLSYGEIATEMYIEKPSVTTLVQKLVKMNYLQILPGKDKREKIVQLTTFGQQQVREIQQSLLPMFEQSLAGLSDKEIEMATHVLAEIRANVIGGGSV